MKELIEEIEGFQADLERDLGVDGASMTTQRIVDSISDWEYFLRIKDGGAPEENNLRQLRGSMERVPSKSVEGNVYSLAEKLKRTYYQNESN